MGRNEEETRKLFDDWAKSYDIDLLDEGGPLMGYACSIQALEHVLQVAPNSHILDIGIGSGAITKRLAAQGAQITGIDISEKMLALCREQNPDFTLYTGTFNSIPLLNESVNYVVSGFAFHETPVSARRDACQEMARVLQPGGYLCLLDIMFASSLAMQEARKLIGDKWDDDEDYAIVGELDTLLRENGFVSLKWYQAAPFHWIVTARKS
jgi:ubiquinone/menaquinone biosynthesis C-methylase UbiE